MNDQKTYEQERDEAALNEIRRLDAIFGDSDINPRCIIRYGNFMADWCKARFEKIVAEKDAQIEEYHAWIVKSVIREHFSEELIAGKDAQLKFSTSLAIQHGECANKLQNQLVFRDAMIEKMKIALEKYKNVVPVEPRGFERTVYVAKDMLAELAEWEKNKP